MTVDAHFFLVVSLIWLVRFPISDMLAKVPSRYNDLIVTVSFFILAPILVGLAVAIAPPALEN